MDDFASHTNIAWSGHVGVVNYGGDNQIVLFYNKSVPNPAKAAETGRPYHEDVVFVRMHPPGERLNIVDRPVRQGDTQRFPMQWAQFQQNKQQTASGTPIELLYPEHPSIAATLRANGVQTIEQCGELSGVAIDQIGMGAQQYCNDSKKYLEMAQKGVHHTHMRKELEERDSQIRVLNQKVESLSAQLDKVMTANQSTPSAEQMHALLASMMQRPQFPPAGVAPAPQFDVQAAQITALSPTTEAANVANRQRRTRTKL